GAARLLRAGAAGDADRSGSCAAGRVRHEQQSLPTQRVPRARLRLRIANAIPAATVRERSFFGLNCPSRRWLAAALPLFPVTRGTDRAAVGETSGSAGRWRLPWWN